MNESIKKNMPNQAAYHPYKLGSCIQAALIGSVLTSSVISTQVLAENTMKNSVNKAKEPSQKYSIVAGELSSALSAFSAQAGILLSIDGTKIKNKKSKGLKGNYTIKQALSVLLQGSGYTAEKTKNGSYVIKKSTDDNIVGTLAKTSVTGGARFGNAPQEEDGFKAEYQTTATKMAMPLKETPQAISVVTRDSLDERQVMDLATAVELTSGVSNSASGGGSYPGPGAFAGRGQHEQKFMLRGQPADVRTDGFRTTGVYGSTSGVDLSAFERIEVVKGPSGFYGQGSLGGFINQVRKNPQEEFSANISAQIGSYDSYRTEADITGALTEDGNVKGQLSMLYDNSGAFVDDLESERFLFAPSVEFIVSEKTQVLLQTLYQKDEFDAYTGVPMDLVGDKLELFDTLSSRTSLYGSTGDKSKVEITEVTATIKHQLSDKWLASLLLQKAKREQNTIIGNYAYVYYGYLYSGGLKDNWDRDSWAGELRLQGSFDAFGFEHQVLLGVEKNAQNRLRDTGINEIYLAENPGSFEGDFSNYPFIPEVEIDTSIYKNEKTDNQAIYAQTILSLHEHTKLLIGARYDDNNQSTNADYPTSNRTPVFDKKNNKEFTYRIGLTQSINENISAYGLYATSFLPTLSAGRDDILDPQTGDGFELGLKTDWFNNQLGVTLAAYRQDLDNRPITDPESRIDDLAGTYSMSAGLHRTEALELEITGSPFDGLTIAGAVSLMDNEFTEDDDPNKGLSISGSVDQQFSLYANYEWQQGPLTGLALGATFVSVGERQFLVYDENYDAVQGYLDGYHRVDLNVSYTGLKNWDMGLLLRNVTDENYIDAASSNLYSGYYFGSPTAVSLNVTYHFD
jgi:outer membrane receptor for ferric coprogen and ferric-rhodotorulic acid